MEIKEFSALTGLEFVRMNTVECLPLYLISNKDNGREVGTFEYVLHGNGYNWILDIFDNANNYNYRETHTLHTEVLQAVFDRMVVGQNHKLKGQIVEAKFNLSNLLNSCLHVHVIKIGNSVICDICHKDLGWWCEDSPTHVCDYNHPETENDPAYYDEDECIHCGNPEERK